MKFHAAATLCGGRDFNFLSQASDTRDGLTKFARRLQVSLDGFENVALGLLKGFPSCNAARQIGCVGGPVTLRLLKNDSVFLIHCFGSSGIEGRFQRARGNIVARVSRNCDNVSNMPPAIRLDEPQQIPNFTALYCSAPPRGGEGPGARR